MKPILLNKISLLGICIFLFALNINSTEKAKKTKKILTPAKVEKAVVAEKKEVPDLDKASIALEKLMKGNERFVSGKSIRPNQTLERIKETSKGQNPFAIIVGCSDSRVPNEIIFDQGVGDLFIVRTAGQVSTYASWASIEFAEEVLGAKLILVLGHTKCGAVAAACKVPEVPGHIVTLINSIKPAAEKAEHLEGDHVENTVKINVAMQVKAFKGLEPVLTKRIKDGSIKIVGGVYDLETGKVELIPEDYLSTIESKKGKN